MAMTVTPLVVLWGKLQRIGGEEKNNCIPPTIYLRANPSFVGRMVEAVPNKDFSFTHTEQAMIPCAFVSSTHFSIEITPDHEGSRHIVLKDYSRNGTFHNGDLVGMKNEVKLEDGDSIALRYKGVDKIVYSFHRCSQIDSEDLSLPTVSKPSNKRKLMEMDTHDNQQVDQMFAQQIMKLQQESQDLTLRLKQQQEAMFTVTSDKEKLEYQVKVTDEQNVKLQQEVKELQERLQCTESQLSATEARNQILSNQENKLQQEQKEYKLKLQQYQLDLKDKETQMEMRIQLLEDANQALVHEKQHRESCQQHILTLQEAIEGLEQRGERMKKANSVLQEVVKDKDQQMLKLQGYCQQQQRQAEAVQQHHSLIMAAYHQIQEQWATMKIQSNFIGDIFEQSKELKQNYEEDFVEGDVALSKRLTSTKSENDETCHEQVSASFPFTGLLQSPDESKSSQQQNRDLKGTKKFNQQKGKAGIRSVQTTPSSSQGSHSSKFLAPTNHAMISCTQVAIPEDDDEEGEEDNEETMDANHRHDRAMEFASTQIPVGDDDNNDDNDDVMEDEEIEGKKKVETVEPLRSQSHVMSQIHPPYNNHELAVSQIKKLSQNNAANTSGIDMPLLSQDSYIRNQQTSSNATTNNSNNNSAIKSSQSKSVPTTPGSVKLSQQNRDVMASQGLQETSMSQTHDSSSIILTGSAMKTSLLDDVYISSTPKALLNESLLREDDHVEEETNDKDDNMLVDVHSENDEMDDDNTVDAE